MVDLGMPPMEAIRAATYWPAQMLKQTNLGTVAPGKLADGDRGGWRPAHRHGFAAAHRPRDQRMGRCSSRLDMPAPPRSAALARDDEPNFPCTGTAIPRTRTSDRVGDSIGTPDGFTCCSSVFEGDAGGGVCVRAGSMGSSRSLGPAGPRAAHRRTTAGETRGLRH